MITLSLTGGKTAFIDEIDCERVSKYKWSARKRSKGSIGFYAVRTDKTIKGKSGRTIYMHRFILNAPDGVEVDHVNRDTLDNRRSNIRLCNHSQNMRNVRPIIKNRTSRFRGAGWHKCNQNWRASIRINGKSKHLGSFDSEIEAARKYDEVARPLLGEFAILNFG